MQNRVSEKGCVGGSCVLFFCLKNAEPTAAPNHFKHLYWNLSERSWVLLPWKWGHLFKCLIQRLKNVVLRFPPWKSPSAPKNKVLNLNSKSVGALLEQADKDYWVPIALNWCIFFKGREILPSPCSYFRSIWRNEGGSHTFLSLVWFDFTNLDRRHEIQVSKCKWERRKVKADLALVIRGIKLCQDYETHRVLAGVASQSTYTDEHCVLRGNKAVGHPMRSSAAGLPVHVLPSVLSSTATLKKQKNQTPKPSFPPAQ